MQSIVIADAHNLCREALCDYIRHADSNYSISSFGDYKSLTDYMTNGRADLILIDVDLPGLQDDSPFFKHKGPLKVGMIVPMSCKASFPDARVNGVFPKNLSCKGFMKGINEILAGHDFFPVMEPDTTPEGAGYFKRNSQDFNLTTREKEVLTHLVKGESNKDIARALNLQVVTIKLHVRGICRKMKASNSTQAALIAKENGWG